MLVLMVVAATAVWPWPLVQADPLCRDHVVRTGKVLHVQKAAPGDLLYSLFRTIRLIKHPCKRNLAVYLGTRIFFTTDNFGSSLVPLTIPKSMKVGVPQVSSAHFAGTALLLVVNQKVYIYEYQNRSWNMASGLEHPVSHVSGDSCCYGHNSVCSKMSDSVFAYLYGEDISQTTIYYSKSYGYNFEKFALYNQEKILGSLGGIFFLHSLSQIGMLVLNKTVAKFAYSHYPLNQRFGMSFGCRGNIEVIITPGQKGILVIWSEDSLLISLNAGQLVSPVTLAFSRKEFHSSVFEANLSIHSIAVNDNELAVLMRQGDMYYGNLASLPSSVIKLSDENLWSQEAGLIFSHLGKVEIMTPLPDMHFPAFDFNWCSLNIQAILMAPRLQIENCKEKSSKVTLKVGLGIGISAEPPKGRTLKVIMVIFSTEVTVSNPHALGFQVSVQEEGYTLDGSTKYQLNIFLKQQHLLGKADPGFISSIQRPVLSTVTVDIANKEISCIDVKPATALVSVGCEAGKIIVVHKDVSACSRGILNPVALKNSYHYLIEKDTYDPSFHRLQKANKDQKVQYQYEKLGCPGLVYYDRPWKPVVELWRNGEFQEVVNAQYVLLEMNGILTYTYSLTAKEALCKSQPQNWTSLMVEGGDNSYIWNRENYRSCHEANSDFPLMWPDVPYEILGGPTDNKIIFDQRNGIYVFMLTIVDPYYSYCHLQTDFSIYVYGAFPHQILPTELTMTLLTLSLLLALWVAYKCSTPR